VVRALRLRGDRDLVAPGDRCAGTPERPDGRVLRSPAAPGEEGEIYLRGAYGQAHVARFQQGASSQQGSSLHKTSADGVRIGNGPFIAGAQISKHSSRKYRSRERSEKERDGYVACMQAMGYTSAQK
jgi:hypothetical protein